MRIGLLAPSIYMSPTRFGDMIFAPRDLAVSLADGLGRAGHDVYFFTAPDIQTTATLISGDEELLSGVLHESKLAAGDPVRAKWAAFYRTKQLYELDLTQRAYQMARAGKLDIIHAYHDTDAHVFDDLTGFPTVYTLHDPVPKSDAGLEAWTLAHFPKQNYVSISDAQRGGGLPLHFVDTVYHGIPVDQYLVGIGGTSFVSMGRMVPEKGIDVAIQAAQTVGLGIDIATDDAGVLEKSAYYQTVVAPMVGKDVVLHAHLDTAGKMALLGSARALLFPIGWEEPFGMVMIEAMACGTPVIAYNRGSVAEIVQDGVTGFIIDPDDTERPRKGTWVIKKQGIEGLVEAVKRIGEIDRAACRRHVAECFSVQQMVKGYEAVYQKILQEK